MKNLRSELIALIPVALLALLSTVNARRSTLFAQGTAFTYQGRLTDGTNAAQGSYDLRLSLRDALTAGNPVGTADTVAPVAVSNGLFTVMLDFGAGIFTGPPRWLEIGVRTNGSVAAYTTLSPRQALTATPYAITAGNITGLVPSSSVAVPPQLSGNFAEAGIVSGTNSNIGGAGVVGVNTATGVGSGGVGVDGQGKVGVSGRGSATGVSGSSSSAGGTGVHGGSTSGTGVSGSSTSGDGVNGTSGKNGVHGVSSSASDSGVWGESVGNGFGVSGSSGGGIGVFGSSTSGDGVYGGGRNGVHGVSSSASDSGVWGQNTGNGFGVFGNSSGGNGVNGTSSSSNGVYGRSAAAGSTVAGVYGENSAAGGTAVVGTALNINSAGMAGVADFSGSTGVYGRGTTYGVLGTSGPGGNGVYGTCREGDGVVGVANQQTGSFSANAAVHGIAQGLAFAGVFDGELACFGQSHSLNGAFVNVHGDLWTDSLIVSGHKQFRIDHPQDPANKYLVHSCVESPDVKNMYDGTITTDASGEATVTLPDYFEALNRDFRYQLTVLGQFVQAIVSREIKENHFTIKTDKPNVKVSWQVTGIRQDAYMKTHPMVVEQEKPANERGTYLHPELFGQPEEKGLSWSRNPESWKRLKAERTKPPTSPKP